MRGNRVLRERQSFGPAKSSCPVIIRDVHLAQPETEFIQVNQ